VSLFEQHDPGGLRRGRIRYLPVVPGKLEFASLVREEILREPPDVLAVELPVTLEETYLRAVDRLPEISVVIYDDEGADQSVYIPIEPADPFIEALRSAREKKIETAFLDPDIGERPHLDDVYPDSYALPRVGLQSYVGRYRAWPRPRTQQVAVHAEGLAWKLQGMRPDAEILVVVSLNLLDPLLDAMESPQTQPMRKAKRQGIHILNLHPESLAEVLADLPLLQAAYEAKRSGKRPSAPEPARERIVQGFGVVERSESDIKAAALARICDDDLDRQKVNLQLFPETARLYERSTGERVQPWQKRLWSRYTRNLAVTEQRLLPSLFDMTVGARSVVDDNFGWEMWELAGYYPAQKIQTDLATVKVSGEQMWLNTRRIQLRPRTRSKKGRGKPVGLRGRKREKTPGEWKKEWKGTGICSYPPEDLVIEDYGLYLKKKGKSILSEERSRVEPFTTSMLDGIDLRETLRNWHQRKIFVRENQKVSGDVGAVVVIFDEDRDNRYPYCVTWLGEHQNESDMAFYATDPFEKVVGPGIGRAEYGGLLLSMPSQRMADVWSDWDYQFAESKPERLLAAALDYSLERIVVYVAANPPRSLFRSIAARLGRKLVYIPIGQLSPPALKKIRAMHVLDGHDKRETAKDYIW